MYQEHHPNVFVAVALSIIFGSGLLIWGYNKLNGIDLSKPPVIDYSQFELKVKKPSFLIDQANATSTSEKVNEAIKEIFPKEVKEHLNSKLKEHSVYFTKFFRGSSVKQTQIQVNNFLNDFPELKKYNLIDLGAVKCVDAVLPVENRDDLIKNLMAKPEIEKVVAPTDVNHSFEICFRKEQYVSEMKQFLASMPEVKVLSEDKDLDYIMYLDYGTAGSDLKETLDKIRNYYSDIVKVTN